MNAEPLDPKEQLLIARAEDLYRQVTKPLWDPGRQQPSSHAFGPSTADAGMASFSRSSKISPQSARDWHQKYGRSFSHGVWRCTVGDVDDTKTLRAVDDSALPGLKAPGHTYVDYRNLTPREIKDSRSYLLAAAFECATSTERLEGDPPPTVAPA